MDTEAVERNKERFNEAPNIAFVERHLPIYEKALNTLMRTAPSALSLELAQAVQFNNLDRVIAPQVTPDEARRLISVMPDSLVRLSRLISVDYTPHVPIPIFDENGEFNGKDVEWVEVKNFPRTNDHPTRILVGCSDGYHISPTPIPSSVSANDVAVRMYQFHVFMHEFLHTVDYPRRLIGKRERIKLENNGQSFSLETFWQEFGRLYVGKNKEPVSRYAATRLEEIKGECMVSPKIDSALGEQICESFVGYMLGILPNDKDDISFKDAHPEEYGLIDKLCRAKVLVGD